MYSHTHKNTRILDKYLIYALYPYCMPQIITPRVNPIVFSTYYGRCVVVDARVMSSELQCVFLGIQHQIP